MLSTNPTMPHHDQPSGNGGACVRLTPPEPVKAVSPRFHELDALRAVAMLLGIVLHTALFLMPDAMSKEYSDEGYPDQNDDIYALIFFAIHGFRMPVFFLLSGFFTAMLWRRRGLRQLAMHRLRRVGLPLAIGALTVIPITTWAFVWVFAPEKFGVGVMLWWPFIWLSTFNHLWFLWFLLWLAAGFILAAKLGVKFSHPVIWWLAIPLTLVPQLLMVEPVFGPDTSERVVPNPVVLGYYALFFAVGAFFYQRNSVVSRWWTVALLPALTLAFLGGLTFLYEVKAEWVHSAAAVFQVAYAWLMCFGLIGLFRWIAARERFWVRYISDASYWLYLWHLPLVVFGFKLVLDWPVNIHLKFALICVTVTAILLVVYQLGVRYTPIGTTLNGKRVRSS